MNKPGQLTRVCSSCGVQKPLSAFLQLSSGQGTTYGTVCADCRRTVIEPKQPKTTKDSGDTGDSNSSSTSFRFRLDAKAKITAELEKKRISQHIKDEYEEETKKRDLDKVEKEVQTEHKEKEAKDHRKFYIETKKQGFLADTKKSVAIKQTTRYRETLDKKTSQQVDERTRAIEAKELEDEIEQELHLTTVDLANQFYDPQFAEIRHHSSLFVQFKQWLGSSSPLGRANAIKAMEMLQKKEQINTDNKSQNNDPLTEFIEKKWSPSSKRGK